MRRVSVTPAALADQLALLVEGAIVMALMEDRSDWASTAKEAARSLIRSAQPTANATVTN